MTGDPFFGGGLNANTAIRCFVPLRATNIDGVALHVSYD